MSPKLRSVLLQVLLALGLLAVGFGLAWFDVRPPFCCEGGSAAEEHR